MLWRLPRRGRGLENYVDLLFLQREGIRNMREEWRTPAFLAATLAVLVFLVYREISLPGGPLRITAQAPAFTQANLTLGSSVSETAENPVSAAVPVSDTERDKKIAAAVAKYGERLVAREFMEDLRTDPCSAKVVADRKVSNILEALSAARDSGCLDKLKLKYVFRPSFIKLMAEIMSDPEIGPLVKTFTTGAALPVEILVSSPTRQKAAIPRTQ